MREAFASSVTDVLGDAKLDDPLLVGLLVQTAIVNCYKSMKDGGLSEICDAMGIDFQSILEEEYRKILDKYFKKS